MPNWNLNIRSETNGIAERAVRRVKEGTSAVLLQLGLDENWWGRFHGMLYLSAKTSTDLLSDGKTPFERTFWANHLKGPIVPFGSLVEYYPVSAKDQSRIHQFGKKVLPGLFLGYALYAGWEFGRATYWSQTLRSCRRWRHRKSTRKDSMQKEVIFPKEKVEFIFSNHRWTIQTSWRRSRPENIHLDTASTNSRRKSRWFSWTIRRVSSTTSRLISGCPWSDKWLLVRPCQETSYTAITLNQGVKLCSPREELFPHSTEIHWRPPEVHIQTWMLSKKTSMGQEICLIHGQVFTQFTLLEEKTSKRRNVVWGEIYEKTADIQARSFMARTLDEIGKKCQAEGEAKSGHMKNLNSIMPEDYEESISLTLMDKEFKETIKNARRKLETPMAPAMPCKISKNNQNCGNGDKSNETKSKLACILEANESTRMRMGNSIPHHHEDHIAGKGEKFMTALQFGSQFYFYASSYENSCSESSSGQGMGKNWRKIRRGNLTKVRSKKEVIDEARTKGAKVHFASLMDICHLKNAELEAKHQKYKGRVVLRGDIVKRWFWFVCSVHWTRIISISNDSRKKSWISSPDCRVAQGQAADAVSAETQVNMEDAPKLLKKITKSECPDILIRLPRHKMA